MDSLLQSYASSDDEEEEEQPISKSVEVLSEPPQPIRSLPSLPPPKSSGLSSLLPPPKTSSVFSSLPPPNTSSPFSSLPTPSASEPKPKRVVQFRPPPMVKPPIDDDDDEEEEKRRKLVKETPSNPTSSLSSFFSSLPAPRNTLGSGSAPSLGAGRRSIIETNIIPPSNYEVEIVQENEGVGINESQEPLTSAIDPSSYPYYEDNNHQNYGNYDIVEPSAASLMPPPPPPEASGFFGRKRGRNDMATVIEVKQDELMKNRPREDQAKSTGIAFGPSYQPAGTATSSGKGKPSKLHKRKHQIGALYFDMRAKESELAERRSKGFLTKAETQAKYGW